MEIICLSLARQRTVNEPQSLAQSRLPAKIQEIAKGVPMEINTVLICGDREWTDQKLVDEVVFRLKKLYNIQKVVHGKARGADTCGGRAAEKYGLIVEEYPAEWHKYGKRAGPIRNAQQLREGKPDATIAFHDNIGESRGTIDMIKKSVQSDREIVVVLVYHSSNEKPFDWDFFSPSNDEFTLDIN